MQKKTQKTINGLNGAATSPFSDIEIRNAIFAVHDAMNRASIPFILLDVLAKEMYDNLTSFIIDEVSIAVQKRHWTKSGASIFKMVVPSAIVTEDNVSWQVGKVPVVVWIVKKKYNFFERPDVRIFLQEEFNIPNPFPKYWKARFLLK